MVTYNWFEEKRGLSFKVNVYHCFDLKSHSSEVSAINFLHIEKITFFFYLMKRCRGKYPLRNTFLISMTLIDPIFRQEMCQKKNFNPVNVNFSHCGSFSLATGLPETLITYSKFFSTFPKSITLQQSTQPPNQWRIYYPNTFLRKNHGLIAETSGRRITHWGVDGWIRHEGESTLARGACYSPPRVHSNREWWVGVLSADWS